VKQLIIKEETTSIVIKNKNIYIELILRRNSYNLCGRERED